MDADVRDAERRFSESPGPATALELLKLGARARAWPEAAARWALDVARWDGLPRELQEVTAQGAAAILEADAFELVGFGEPELGGLRHRIATFEQEGRKFALLPGGRVTLGYDPRALRPSAEQVEDMQSFCDQLDLAVSFRAGPQAFLAGHLERAFTPVREVTIDPLLVEVKPRPSDEVTDEIEEIAEGGPAVRLLTSDEWEHVCGAGARRLFRWGDGCPPSQSPRANAPFGDHRKPNAFGLVLPGDTSTTELCEDFRFRGGDAGTILRWADTTYLAWLTLATAYDHSPTVEAMRLGTGEPVARLVWPLFPPR